MAIVIEAPYSVRNLQNSNNFANMLKAYYGTATTSKSGKVMTKALKR